MTRRQSEVELVTTPTRAWLVERAQECRQSFLAVSPFVNDGMLAISNAVTPSAKRTLVTRTDLRDFAAGASSLDALCSLSETGIDIRRLPALHAKVYVFDDGPALVTSANATRAGLGVNWECGVALHDPALVRDLAQMALNGFGAEEPPATVRLQDLRTLTPLIEGLRRAIPSIARRPLPQALEAMEQAPLVLERRRRLLSRFTGWNRLTLEAVLALPSDVFTTADIYPIARNMAARQYPRNRFPDDKVRQRLQHLRDLGLVEFLGDGQYRRTVR